MRERTYDAYRVQNEGQSNDGYGYRSGASGRGGFGGHGHGGMVGRGRGQVVCYNCNQAGHLACDCRNPTTTCRYCRAVDHVIEQCPQLIAKIQEINSAPTQHIQMIFVKQRPAPAINVVTRSGAMTHIQNKEKYPDEAWVCKALVKAPAFDIEREKETFMAAKKDFVDSSPAVAPVQPHHQ